MHLHLHMSPVSSTCPPAVKRVERELRERGDIADDGSDDRSRRFPLVDGEIPL